MSNFEIATEEQWADVNFARSRLLLHKENFFVWFYDCFRSRDEGTGEVRPAPKWQYLYWIYYYLSRKPDDPDFVKVLWIEKSRQQFVTWFMVAYYTWRLLFDENKRLIYTSKTEDQVKDVLRTRFATVMANYPSYIPHPELDIQSTYIRKYTGTGKKKEESMLLRGISSSGKGSRGDTGAKLWIDEVAEIEEQESLIDASMDSFNAPDAQIIGVTTGSAEPMAEYSRYLIADSIDPDIPVRELSRGVRFFKNTRGHGILQIDYDANPNKRSQEWYDEQMKEKGYVAFMINHGHMWEVPQGSLCYWAANKERHAKPTLYDPRARLWIGVDPGSENGVIGVSFHQIVNKCVKVLDGYALEQAGLAGATECISEFLDKHNVYNFRIIIDPAGAVSNPHGLADNALTTLNNAFPGKVGYCAKSKPEQRIDFINNNLFNTDPVSILIPENVGFYVHGDGRVETNFFWKCLTMYVLGSNGKPKKDNKHDHMLDAWSYAIMASCKPGMAQGFIESPKNPIQKLEAEQRKRELMQKKRKFTRI